MQLKRIILLLVASVSFGSLLLAEGSQQREFKAQAQANNIQAPRTKADVPFVPTPTVVVEEMLKQAQPKPNDVLYDLGSGDGRIVITAAQKFRTRGVGVEINPDLIKRSQENAQKAGVSDRVKFLQQDLFKTDLSEATVVTLYLLPEVNLQLRPKLLSELKPGTRIVSHNYHFGEWKPERVVRVKGPQSEHIVFYWVVPQTVPENLRSDTNKN